MLYGLLNFSSCFLPLVIYYYVLVRLFGYRFRSSAHRKVFIAVNSAVSVAGLSASFLIKDRNASDLFFEILLPAAAAVLPVVFMEIKKKVHLFAFGLMYCTTIDFLCIFISSALNRDDDYSDKLLYLMIGVLIFITAFIVSKKSTVNSSKLYPVESISPMLYIVMIISELSIYYDITFAESLPLYKAVSFGLKIISGTVLILGFIIIISSREIPIFNFSC